jgi:hypothetical protein
MSAPIMITVEPGGLKALNLTAPRQGNALTHDGT